MLTHKERHELDCLIEKARASFELEGRGSCYREFYYHPAARQGFCSTEEIDRYRELVCKLMQWPKEWGIMAA